MDASPAIGPGPDELADAIALYRAAIPAGQLRVFDIGALDRLGLSVYVAAFAGATGFVMDGFGYGATPAEAMVGALGEISEAAHVDAALREAPVDIATHAEMVARHGPDAALDPLALCLPAGSPHASGDRLAWVRVRRWPDGAEGVAPLEAIAFQPGQWQARAGGARRLFRPITCGLGAGASLEQALAHGVLELLQRDGNCTAFRAMDRGVAIGLDRIRDPGLAALISGLEAKGLEIRPKLASTEFGLANVYVVGRGLDTGFPLVQTACGEAVHPNAERALRKALLEFAAARCRKTFMHGPLETVARVAPAGYLEDYRRHFDPAAEEPRALAEMRRWTGMDAGGLAAELADTVFARRETVPLSALPSAADAAVRAPADRLADVAGRLAAEGIPVWYFDASPAGADGPRVVKAVAPGLEGETMSYHRIGARGAARLMERGHPLVGREPGAGRARIRLTAVAEAALGGPLWFDTALADRIVGGAYPLYREPSSHAVRLAPVDG